MDIDIRLRETEGSEAQPFLLWDTIWRNTDDLAAPYVDWVLAGAEAPGNAYGLASDHALHTSILLSLFTWRRAESYDNLPAGRDPKGWWGDAIDIDEENKEGPLGSRLWLLYRAVLNDETLRLAVTYCNEALEPIIDQGAVARFDVTATKDQVAGHLVLAVAGYSQTDQKIYDQKFQRIWYQEFK
jgi:phage gp46-like protein